MLLNVKKQWAIDVYIYVSLKSWKLLYVTYNVLRNNEYEIILYRQIFDYALDDNKALQTTSYVIKFGTANWEQMEYHKCLYQQVTLDDYVISVKNVYKSIYQISYWHKKYAKTFLQHVNTA